MPDQKDFLAGYVEVKDRIKVFYELYGQGRLVTEQVEVLTAPDGKQRVMVRALAYRSPDDLHPAVGHSWMELPGTTNYTRGSELENTETSAIGRAIGFLGILVDKSIASANEIRAKSGESSREASADGLIGTVEVGASPADFELREEPDGYVLAFKLMDGRKGFKVVVRGPLAFSLASIKNEVVGKRVTCWGRMGTESFTPKDAKKAITYNVLTLERIQTPDFLLPSPEAVSGPSETDAALDPEIEALPLFQGAA